jgi:hypothetical protein
MGPPSDGRNLPHPGRLRVVHDRIDHPRPARSPRPTAAPCQSAPGRAKPTCEMQARTEPAHPSRPHSAFPTRDWTMTSIPSRCRACSLPGMLSGPPFCPPRYCAGSPSGRSQTTTRLWADKGTGVVFLTVGPTVAFQHSCLDAPEPNNDSRPFIQSALYPVQACHVRVKGRSARDVVRARGRKALCLEAMRKSMQRQQSRRHFSSSAESPGTKTPGGRMALGARGRGISRPRIPDDRVATRPPRSHHRGLIVHKTVNPGRRDRWQYRWSPNSR